MFRQLLKYNESKIVHNNTHEKFTTNKTICSTDQIPFTETDDDFKQHPRLFINVNETILFLCQKTFSNTAFRFKKLHLVKNVFKLTPKLTVCILQSFTNYREVEVEYKTF